MKVNEVIEEGFWSDMGQAVKTAITGQHSASKQATTQDEDEQIYQNWATQASHLVTGGILDPASPDYQTKYAEELTKFLSRGIDPRIVSLFPPINPAVDLVNIPNINKYISKIAAIIRARKDEVKRTGPPSPVPAVQDEWTPSSTNPKFGKLKLSNGKSFVKDTDNRWYRVDASGTKELKSTLSGAQYATLNKRAQAAKMREFE